MTFSIKNDNKQNKARRYYNKLFKKYGIISKYNDINIYVMPNTSPNNINSWNEDYWIDLWK